jgi:tetratricopeptide (TPR) repeat protein
MNHRLAGLLIGSLTLAFPVAAQTLADARTCDQAIGGSAKARASIDAMAKGRNIAAPISHFAAGCLAVISSAWDSAAAHFDAAAKANPTSSATFLWVGNITGQLARIGNMQAKVRLAPAIRDAYSKAIALDGTNIDAREGLMQFLLEAPLPLGGDKTKAAEQAAAIGRVNAFRGLSAQITVASSTNDRPAVERLLSQATTLFPDSILGWANLSAMQADDHRPAEAFATITRWQARRRHPMFALFSIGRTAAVTGEQLDRGVQALQQYLRGQREPKDPPLANAHYRLAQIYEKQHKTAEAKSEYQIAITLNPGLRDAQLALDRLR